MQSLQRQLELLAAENAELRLRQGESDGALDVESEELRLQQEETASALALEAEEQRREQAEAAAALAAENAALRAELEAARSAAETVPITPLDEPIHTADAQGDARTRAAGGPCSRRSSS